MDKNGRTAGAPTAGNMSDAELSLQIGRYQRLSVLWRRIGLAGTLVGLILYFAVSSKLLKAILVTVLFFGGLCCAIFLSGSAQKKLRTLLQDQLGSFFRETFEKAFGPNLHTEAMRIDKACMDAFCLRDRPWEECEIENLHEGVHRGTRFSAANVRLMHVHKRGTIQEGYETIRDLVCKGLVIRCETCTAAPSPIRINAQLPADTQNMAAVGAQSFDNRFRIAAGDDAAPLLTPQFKESLLEFEQSVNAELLGVYWKDQILSLALETDYAFAAVASNVNLRDLDGVRRSYAVSLQEMGGALDLLLKNTTLYPQKS